MRIGFGGGPAIGVESDDAATLGWLLEFYGPALAETTRTAEQRVEIVASDDRRTEMRSRVPADAPTRPCFAFDQRLHPLPATEAADGVTFDDIERSCAFHVSPGSVELAGDPASKRWRFTTLLIVHELIATPLRTRRLELHAAAVEHEGQALLMPGPKGAGKTTLSLHLLRSGACRQMANDRVFAHSDEIRGMPHAVKVLPETGAEFPELVAGRPWIDRPHIHTIAELAQLADEPLPPATSLMLSPAQLAERMGVDAVAAAPPGAILFPEVVPKYDGEALEGLAEAEVRAAIWTNLYGSGGARREATVFEEMAGSRGTPSSEIADALAAAAPGYRVRLGRRAREDPDFGRRLLDELSA